MNILILGDSWSADWSEKNSEFKGWPELLATKYNVTNVSEAGVSQYKICKQIENSNYQDYDLIICSITSPNRIYSKSKINKVSKFHKNCDLIFQDIEFAVAQGDSTPEITSALNYFIYHWDKDYADFVHQLKVDWCYDHLKNYNTIFTSIIDDSKKFLPSDAIFIDGFEIFETYPGNINHLSEEGNNIFFKNLTDKLMQVSKE